MSTIKLYDIDAYTDNFVATVINSQEENGIYKVILDKTAFFPEAGGQKADNGYIGGAKILDVQIENEIIYHFTDKPLNIGENVDCKIDFAERFRKMQIHTGEHIVSGVMHSLYGLDNVGFHLGSDEVTLDFNAELTREQLDKAELLANKIVYKNVPVLCYYPEEKELSNIDYRSKKELDGNIRIVEIKGYDKCACCAPHVKATGEVGIIKLSHFEKNKNGTRITLLCGPDALKDYREKYKNVSAISAMLCAKPEETAKAVENLLNEKNNLNYEITALKRSIIELKADTTEVSNEPIVIFEDNLSVSDARNYANALILKRPEVYIFSPVADGFSFVCAGNKLSSVIEKMKTRFTLKGGGNDKMIQGTIYSTDGELKDFLQTNIDKKI